MLGQSYPNRRYLLAATSIGQVDDTTPALTYRDANANAMIDMLDLTFPAFAWPPKLAEPLEESDPAPLACNNSGRGTIPPPGSVTGP